MVLSPLPVLEGAKETDPLPLPEEPQAVRERDSAAAVRAQVIFQVFCDARNSFFLFRILKPRDQPR